MSHSCALVSVWTLTSTSCCLSSTCSASSLWFASPCSTAMAPTRLMAWRICRLGLHLPSASSLLETWEEPLLFASPRGSTKDLSGIWAAKMHRLLSLTMRTSYMAWWALSSHKRPIALLMLLRLLMRLTQPKIAPRNWMMITSKNS